MQCCAKRGKNETNLRWKICNALRTNSWKTIVVTVNVEKRSAMKMNGTNLVWKIQKKNKLWCYVDGDFASCWYCRVLLWLWCNREMHEIFMEWRGDFATFENLIRGNFMINLYNYFFSDSLWIMYGNIVSFKNYPFGIIHEIQSSNERNMFLT